MILTVIAQNKLKLTVGWTPPAGVTGYRFFRDGAPVSTSFDPAKTQVTFGIPDSKEHSYSVVALRRIDSGNITIQKPLTVSVTGTPTVDSQLKAVIS